MSSAIDARQRPSLWSYLSFSSPPRRRSVSLPKPNGAHDPYEKYDRHSGIRPAYSPPRDTEQDVGMIRGQRSRYVKIGGIVAFVVFVLYMFAPGQGGNLINSQLAAPTTSDSSVGTMKCSKSSSPNKPLIQYALMIDAGSTGSRIHIYRFNNCGESPELEDEVFKMTEKREGGSGLSSYKNDAEGAAGSLDVLMEAAMQAVPAHLRSCSPVAVKATAGLRLLGKEMSDAILSAVRTRLETTYPFPVVSKEKDGVEIMDGKDEGVYAWITTNYLLGKIGGPDKSPTAAIFDLGGGSTQIVFEPTFKSSPSGGMPEVLAEGDHKYTLSFGGRSFSLYQHSHLGYGLMSAREAMHKAFLTASLGLSPSPPFPETFTNPCIAPGTSKTVTVKFSETQSITANMTGPTSPSPAQCRGLAEKVLQKDASCTLSPCSFNGIHQPSLSKTFSREDIYIFSYFYDRVAPLGMPESFTIAELRDLTAKVCGGEQHWTEFKGVEGALEELKDRPEYCLDLNFMLALLHTGYEMGLGREVKTAKKIGGRELGWCLGASLPLLSQDSGWQCRIKEVS